MIVRNERAEKNPRIPETQPWDTPASSKVAICRITLAPASMMGMASAHPVPSPKTHPQVEDGNKTHEGKHG